MGGFKITKYLSFSKCHFEDINEKYALLLFELYNTLVLLNFFLIYVYAIAHLMPIRLIIQMARHTPHVLMTVH